MAPGSFGAGVKVEVIKLVVMEMRNSQGNGCHGNGVCRPDVGAACGVLLTLRCLSFALTSALVDQEVHRRPSAEV